MHPWEYWSQYSSHSTRTSQTGNQNLLQQDSNWGKSSFGGQGDCWLCFLETSIWSYFTQKGKINQWGGVSQEGSWLSVK